MKKTMQLNQNQLYLERKVQKATKFSAKKTKGKKSPKC